MPKVMLKPRWDGFYLTIPGSTSIQNLIILDWGVGLVDWASFKVSNTSIPVWGALG